MIHVSTPGVVFVEVITVALHEGHRIRIGSGPSWE